MGNDCLHSLSVCMDVRVPNIVMYDRKKCYAVIEFQVDRGLKNRSPKSRHTPSDTYQTNLDSRFPTVRSTPSNFVLEK